jgi:CIC family chloride channel protein
MSDDGATPPDEADGSLLVLAALALIAGAAAGLLGAMFRLALQQADAFREAVLAAAHGAELPGLIYVVLACGTATGVAAFLVRRFSPHASGSGIPRVEAVLAGALPPAPLRLIVVKFIGGVLAIGSGLALGREGPSVQIGATVAHVIGQVGRRNWPDCRVLLAAGAGAGLATAFNAPIAGAIFVLEELVRRFEPRIAIAALGASATAIVVARLFLGNAPDFQVAPLPYPSIETEPLYFVLGIVAGALGIVYNRTLLGAIAVANRLRVPVELRAAVIGAAVGVLAWFAPNLVGGGDMISQRTLLGAEALAVIPAAFVLRLALGAVSYAAGTPGGLFAPMLVLGAQIGLLFGGASQFVFPTLGIEPTGFAVVGMAALFTGVVRAPLTGMVLATEMTASFTMLLPMLGACFMAMLVPTMMRDPPIYDALRELGYAGEKDGPPQPAPKVEARDSKTSRDKRKRGRGKRRKSGQR